MTMVELMVAMTIGLFLIGGSLYLYTQSKNSYRAGDSLSRLQETARFALDTLEPDVRLAGFWGQNAAPDSITAPAGLVIACNDGGANATELVFGTAARPLAAVAASDSYDMPCPAFADEPRADSDVLVIRRAAATAIPAADADAGTLYVRSTPNQGRIFADGVPPADLADPARDNTYEVVTHAYYVSNRSGSDPAAPDTAPSLRRLTIRGLTIGQEEIIPGVENLQVQFGMDTDGDANVDRYVDPDNAILDPDDPTFLPAARVVAVRIWMLVSEPAADQAWVDRGPYTTPDADLEPIATGSDAYPANSRRTQIAKTIYLRNQADSGPIS